MSRITAKDIREMPLYSPAEAARFLNLPVSTVRAWSFGQAYRGSKGEQNRFQPVITVADLKNRRLSFINLVEILVLAAIRRQHRVPLPQVRDAVHYLRKQFSSAHPLADHEFQTNGIHIFVEKFGKILNISRDGQIEMRQLIEAYLRGVERDAKGIPIKLHLPGRQLSQKPGRVVIDPSRGFGRPMVDGLGIRTEVVIQRFHAGETIESLAEDYAVGRDVIEDIMRIEWPLAA